MDFVLLKEIYEFVDVKCARTIAVKLFEDSFDHLVLPYLLITHQILLFDGNSVLAVSILAIRLFEFIKLDFFLKPVFRRQLHQLFVIIVENFFNPPVESWFFGPRNVRVVWV